MVPESNLPATFWPAQGGPGPTTPSAPLAPDPPPPRAHSTPAVTTVATRWQDCPLPRTKTTATQVGCWVYLFTLVIDLFSRHSFMVLFPKRRWLLPHL